MDEEAVVQRPNGILLSHKKEHTWGCSNEVDEQSEVSQRKINIVYWHIYMESKEMACGIYFQGSNGETEYRPMDMRGGEEGEGELCGESNLELCKVES